MKLYTKYKYLKFLKNFDTTKHNEIPFNIKRYEPLLKELFDGKDESIYIEIVNYLEELKNKDVFKDLELIKNCKIAIIITNYFNRHIYLLFDEKFNIGFIIYELDNNNNLKIIKTKPYYDFYNCDNLLFYFLAYIYDGIF